jgi:hypothetical protein
MTIKQRIQRLERLKRRDRTAPVSFWDVLCGAALPEDLAPEDAQRWAELESILCADRVADKDFIEARVLEGLASATAPSQARPDNHHD